MACVMWQLDTFRNPLCNVCPDVVLCSDIFELLLACMLASAIQPANMYGMVIFGGHSLTDLGLFGG